MSSPGSRRFSRSARRRRRTAAPSRPRLASFCSPSSRVRRSRRPCRRSRRAPCGPPAGRRAACRSPAAAARAPRRRRSRTRRRPRPRRRSRARARRSSGSSRAITRGVKPLLTSPRTRVWRGSSSMLSISPATAVSCRKVPPAARAPPPTDEKVRGIEEHRQHVGVARHHPEALAVGRVRASARCQKTGASSRSQRKVSCGKPAAKRSRSQRSMAAGSTRRFYAALVAGVPRRDIPRPGRRPARRTGGIDGTLAARRRLRGSDLHRHRRRAGNRARRGARLRARTARRSRSWTSTRAASRRPATRSRPRACLRRSRSRPTSRTRRRSRRPSAGCSRRPAASTASSTSAGITRDSRIAKKSYADFKAVIAVHLFGTFLFTREVATAHWHPLFKQNGRPAAARRREPLHRELLVGVGAKRQHRPGRLHGRQGRHRVADQDDGARVRGLRRARERDCAGPRQDARCWRRSASRASRRWRARPWSVASRSRTRWPRRSAPIADGRLFGYTTGQVFAANGGMYLD